MVVETHCWARDRKTLPGSIRDVFQVTGQFEIQISLETTLSHLEEAYCKAWKGILSWVLSIPGVTCTKVFLSCSYLSIQSHEFPRRFEYLNFFINMAYAVMTKLVFTVSTCRREKILLLYYYFQFKPIPVYLQYCFRLLYFTWKLYKKFFWNNNQSSLIPLA